MAQQVYVQHQPQPVPQPHPGHVNVTVQGGAPPQPQPVYVQQPAQPAPAPVTVVKDAPMPPVACRDDKNPIGQFGCDKRVAPTCCASLCCPACVLTSYEGCSVAAIFAWIPLFGIGFWPCSCMGCYAACCWNPPIWGVHYNKSRVVVGGAMQVAQPAPAHVTYVQAGSDEHIGGHEYPEFLDVDEDDFSDCSDDELLVV
ncbi:unnamed protein product [Amoebophrya sp. A120]|nr:unnamed protein product [Amoebophrya sp. A120]|eukprot:GSA120T00002263001.1